MISSDFFHFAIADDENDDVGFSFSSSSRLAFGASGSQVRKT